MATGKEISVMFEKRRIKVIVQNTIAVTSIKTSSSLVTVDVPAIVTDIIVISFNN